MSRPPCAAENPGRLSLKIQQTSPKSKDKTTPLFSKPAYLTKTSAALEIHIPDCFWYPQISFDWKKLSLKEFHILIEKIRAGITCIIRQIYPAEENIDRGFSRLSKEYRKKNPDGKIAIILHPIQPHSPAVSLSYETPSKAAEPPRTETKKKTAGKDTAKRWMEYNELKDKISLACELRKTGGYIIRTSTLLKCTRQQIHTAMKYHGFLRGEILIFRGVV